MQVLVFLERQCGSYLFSCRISKISEYLLSLSFEVEYGSAQNTRQTQSYMILKYKVILKQKFLPKNRFGRLLLYKLENISAYRACIIDVSPLSDFTQLQYLTFWQNKINNEDTLKHHPNFSEYDFSDQKFPTIDELKFYNIILSVHNSHKQIRKIQAEKRVSKFQESMTHQKKVST
ncbi:Leucine-rich_repeat domain superfamily [Hexamita inflata]|uniref:Leucine-rich repeat domain superfamily n=1 Tax=Hexamita inflata TaxID=28002 RepID=A0AA86Q155_9EUKA|nr:Leucine-rich repeat domain superfamily [Hexamita inflata]